ncbi:hypothetical protein T4B_14568 [Trichinella pseudospiralis]|uniref:Uncharacterized protein n=1 Tax=Trichinella pseudospiralis TaxID=6337 RepID=A0A0V1GB68_TRIPS|nr:hypothetical protein T4A_8533 [Trichinella pseudospiralis]KRY95524.1 hypothetical protein T4B_14568 [Trichinella pseudospiralis]
MPCRDEFRVHLRKEKWLNNLSIISKQILLSLNSSARLGGM